MDDNIDALMFLYSVIFVHKLDIIRKEYVVWLQIYSAALLANIIKIGQHLTERVITKIKKGELTFETQCTSH